MFFMSAWAIVAASGGYSDDGFSSDATLGAADGDPVGGGTVLSFTLCDPPQPDKDETASVNAINNNRFQISPFI